MTRIIWQMIKDKLLLPYLDVNVEYYDLGLQAPRRDRRPGHGRRGRGHQEATASASSAPPSRPTRTAWRSTASRRQWTSPNGTIRAMLDGTVFRSPILVKNIQPVGAHLEEAHHHRPPRLRRRLQERGDSACPARARPSWSSPAADGGQTIRVTHPRVRGPGRRQGIHNTDDSIRSFAKACFTYALDRQAATCGSAAKDTISKIYDARFRDDLRRGVRDRVQGRRSTRPASTTSTPSSTTPWRGS